MCGCKYAIVLPEFATPCFDDQLSLGTLARLVYRHPKEWSFPDFFDTGVSGPFFMSTTSIAESRLVSILVLRRHNRLQKKEDVHLGPWVTGELAYHHCPLCTSWMARVNEFTAPVWYKNDMLRPHLQGVVPCGTRFRWPATGIQRWLQGSAGSASGPIATQLRPLHSRSTARGCRRTGCPLSRHKSLFSPVATC